MNGLTETELREMVRASIARLASAPAGVSGPPSVAGSAGNIDRPATLDHASFARLPLLRGGDGDGACLIEPSVRCNHCGYCLSYGH
ncbi:MAG TPA: hypothetical protein VH497_15230 [Vicinamibacterales bacterium]|jgi:hypothetical protein